jgi:hypothetical protein
MDKVVELFEGMACGIALEAAGMFGICDQNPCVFHDVQFALCN